MPENKLMPIGEMNNNFSALDTIDFTDGFACDMETGICGPINNGGVVRTTVEEKKNANNDLV